MKIGFLIIASEVLDGKISDLNTKILGEFLRPNNLEINESMVVRDDKAAIMDALTKLFLKHDLIITSGGLGPTRDDITKETLGQFLNRKTTFNEEAFKIAEENYSRFKRPFPGKEHGYCYLPEGFVPLSNATGFAPSFYTQHLDKFLFSGPGVPREFKSMLQNHLIKIIDERLPREQVFSHFIVRTKNVPEEKIFGEVDISLWDKLAQFGDVSSLPTLMGVDIGVKVRAKNFSELQDKILALQTIFETSPIHKNIWHIGPESLEEKIVKLAIEKKIKFGFAESATGGLCSHRITNISGSSQVFMGSVICYDEMVKEQLLGVKNQTIKEFGVVSPDCADEMARGLKNLLKVDIAISITGYAGPTGGTDKYPVGSVCIGRAFDTHSSAAESMVLKGDREVLKQRFSQAALYALLEEMEKFAEV